MDGLVIKNNLPKFKRSADEVLDDALREACRDMLVKAKTRAPLLKGGLRSHTLINKRGDHQWDVSFNIEYARFQEFGGTPEKKVKHYTTPGTGAHYLKTSGDEIKQKLPEIFKKHGVRARVW